MPDDNKQLIEQLRAHAEMHDEMIRPESGAVDRQAADLIESLEGEVERRAKMAKAEVELVERLTEQLERQAAVLEALTSDGATAAFMSAASKSPGKVFDTEAIKLGQAAALQHAQEQVGEGNDG